MRKKILILGTLRGVVSGVSTHMNQLFSSELNVRFKLLYFQVGSQWREENGFQKLFRFGSSPLFFFVFLLWHRPVIVHLNTSLEPKSYWRDISYLLIARFLRKKVVYQVHGGALPEEFFAGNRRLTNLLRWVLNQPDVVVLLAQIELKAYKCFLPDQRLEVVPNAIDVLTSWSISDKPEGSLNLVYIGRIGENKGVFEIIETLAALVGQGRDLRLRIGGDGPDEARLRSRVNELGLDERVEFSGPVFGADKDLLWRVSDVFTFPTYHREGLPYALLEAMAAGVVPITTRVGANPDVIQDGIHGLFVEAKDTSGLAKAIISLDEDREQLCRLAAAGRKRILEEYTVANMADNFASIYNSLGVKG